MFDINHNLKNVCKFNLGEKKKKKEWERGFHV